MRQPAPDSRSPLPRGTWFALLLGISLAIGCVSGVSGCSSRSLADIVDPIAVHLQDAPDPEEALPARARTVVWVGGDVLMAEGIRRNLAAEVAADGGTEAEAFARVLEPVASVMRQDPEAFIFVNLETPVATRRNAIDRSGWGGERLVAIPLNAPAYTLSALRLAGVDGLMLSNNHALDQDPEGLVETMNACAAEGFVTSGAGLYPRVSWPITVGERGARVTLVPFYDGHAPPSMPDGTPALADLSDESIAHMAQLRGDTELLVPVVHVLGEAVDRPKPKWRLWARALAEAGADVIVVHGTHVPLPIEMLEVEDRRVPLVWGLGNFVSDMARQATPRRRFYRGMPKDQNPMLREGLVMRMELEEGQRVQLRFLPTWMNDDRFVRFWGGIERPSRYRLLPVAACGLPAPVPEDWTGDLREQTVAWITRRRDHLIRHAGLVAEGCQPGVPALLEARALRER